MEYAIATLLFSYDLLFSLSTIDFFFVDWLWKTWRFRLLASILYHNIVSYIFTLIKHNDFFKAQIFFYYIAFYFINESKTTS